MFMFMSQGYAALEDGIAPVNHNPAQHQPNTPLLIGILTVHLVPVCHAHSILSDWLARPHFPMLAVFATCTATDCQWVVRELCNVCTNCPSFPRGRHCQLGKDGEAHPCDSPNILAYSGTLGWSRLQVKTVAGR